jgi:hypothetical protein
VPSVSHRVHLVDVSAGSRDTGNYSIV